MTETKKEKITLTIQFKVTKENDCIVCNDIAIAMALIGFTSPDRTQFKRYNIEERNGKYYIPILAIQERRSILLDKKNELKRKIEFMNGVLS